MGRMSTYVAYRRTTLHTRLRMRYFVSLIQTVEVGTVLVHLDVSPSPFVNTRAITLDSEARILGQYTQILEYGLPVPSARCSKAEHVLATGMACERFDAIVLRE